MAASSLNLNGKYNSTCFDDWMKLMDEVLEGWWNRKRNVASSRRVRDHEEFARFLGSIGYRHLNLSPKTNLPTFRHGIDQRHESPRD